MDTSAEKNQPSNLETKLAKQLKPPPRGRERFTSNTDILKNKTIGLIMAISAFAGAGYNPLGINPYPFLKDLLFGKSVEIPAPNNSLDRKYQQIAKITPEIQNKPFKKEDTMEVIPDDLKDFALDQTRIKNTSRWKILLEQVIADSRLRIAKVDQPFWIDHMLKIIAIESAGDQNASSGIAFGLTQLKKDTAWEQASKYNINKFDLNNAWDNLFLGTAYQLEMARRFGPEIGAWAHHIGQGNLNSALEAYLKSTLKLPINTANQILENNNLLKNFIEENEITAKKLLESPAVTAKLKAIGAWGDLTWEYPGRFKAVGLAMVN